MTTAVPKPSNEPLAPVVSAPPRRRRLRRLLVVLLMLAAAWLWLVPLLARWQLISGLEAAGFRDVQVASVSVGFGSLRARDLRLGREGAGEVRVLDATAEFTLGDLWAGRLDSLTLVGPTWTMAAAHAASPFDQILRQDGAAGDPPRTALPELPLRLLTIRAGRLVPAAGHGAPVVAFEATLTAGDAGWQFDGRAAAAGHGVQATARLAASPAGAEGPVTLRLVGAQPLELTGTLRAGVIAGERVLDLLVRTGEPPFDVSVAGTSWAGDGLVMVQARANLAQPAAATIDVLLDGVRLEGSNGLRLTGLSTKAALVGLPVPVLARPQQVVWRSAHFGALKGGDGDAELDLKSGLQLTARVQQFAVDGVGVIELTGLRYAPGAASTPAHVEFVRVPLQDWLEMLSSGRITGKGRISGDVDLVLHWQPRPRVELQGGQLAAIDGGVVRFLDDAETKGLIRQHVEQIAAASGHDNVVEERLVGALEDFAYRTLDFRIERGGDGVTLRVHTAGQGRKVPQALDLTVNLNGFDAAVDTALAIKLGLDRAQRRLDDKIDTKNEPEPHEQR